MAFNIFEKWPYTSYENLNLDWLLHQIQDGPVLSVNGKSGIVNLTLGDLIAGSDFDVVQSFDELHDTTAEKVLVMVDDSYFGSGLPVVFQVARSLDTGEKQEITGGYEQPFYEFLKRDNGDYMVPMPLPGSVGSPAPANQISAVISSYFNHGEIKYGSSNTAFTPDYNPNEAPQIDCSGFVALVTYGITYERSRYAGNASNTFGSYAGMTIPRNPRTCIGDGENNRYCYNAAEMAMYYAQQHRLFEIDYSRENVVAQLQPGDILFYSHDFIYEAESGAADYGKRYLNIDHCAIVLNVYPESSSVMVAGAGLPPSPRISQQIALVDGVTRHNNINITVSRISTFDHQTKIGTMVYARPIYQQQDQQANQILGRSLFYKNVQSPTPASPRNLLSRLFFDKPLKANQMYTIIIDGDMPNDPEQYDSLALTFAKTGSAEPIDYRINAINRYGSRVTYVFIPPEDIAERTNIYLIARRAPGAQAVDWNTYNLYKIAVYEGLCIDAPADVQRIDDPLTMVAGKFDTEAAEAELEAWLDGDELHIHFSAPLANGGHVGSMEQICTINNDWFPRIGLTRNLTCICSKTGELDEIRPLTITAGGIMSTYIKQADNAGDLFKFDIII